MHLTASSARAARAMMALRAAMSLSISKSYMVSTGLSVHNCADIPAAGTTGTARIPTEMLRARMILEKNMLADV